MNVDSKEIDTQNAPTAIEAKETVNPAKLVQTPKLPTKLVYCQDQTQDGNESDNKPKS